MAAPRGRQTYKVTVLGDGGVGKTALTVQFTMSSFVIEYSPTIEDVYRKQWSVDGQPCMLEILDTAGQEEYTALRDQWIRDGEGFLIVYSVASRDTFQRIEPIYRRIIRIKEDALSYASYGSPYHQPQSAVRNSIPPVVICGNKRDISHGREVGPEEGARLAQRLGCDFFETSAKTGSNVEAAFKVLVRGIKGGQGGQEVYGAASPRMAAGSGRRKRKKDCVIL